MYAADCTLNNRLDDAREDQIAQHVFHLKGDFGAGADNLVRTEARLLRKQIAFFFATEGRDSPVVISMQRDGYALNFEVRRPANTESKLEDAATVGSSAGRSFKSARTYVEEEMADEATFTGPAPFLSEPLLGWPFWTLLSLVLAILLTIGIVLAVNRSRVKPEATQLMPLAAFIGASKDLDLVTSDASLDIEQKLADHALSLQDYINHQYPPPRNPSDIGLFKDLERKQYTDAYEVALANKFVLEGSRYSRRIFIKSARDVDLGELKEQNVVLFGAPSSNPWSRLYYQDLPFQFDNDDSGVILNRKPQAHELARYVSSQQGEASYAYALMAFLPNLEDGAYSLLLAGSNGEATRAAGDFLMDDGQMTKAYRAMKVERTGNTWYFELLLRARMAPGAATQTTLQAWRLIYPPARQGK